MTVGWRFLCTYLRRFGVWLCGVAIAEPLDAVHAGQMEFHGPEDAAYGRVTNPERYLPVAEAARTLISRLDQVFDAVVIEEIDAPFSDRQGLVGEGIRVEPGSGAPLTFLITEFPGVMVRAGRWSMEAFPSCGCDACGESPGDLIEELERLVLAVSEGRYEEELNRRRLRWSYWGSWGRRSRQRRLDRVTRRSMGKSDRQRYPDWPRRTITGAAS